MASEAGGRVAPSLPPVVVLDANLLYPFHLRNLLVQLGVYAIVAPRWTDRIHEEWITELVATGRVTRERLARTRDLMDRVLPDASVQGWEAQMEGLTLPDPGRPARTGRRYRGGCGDDPHDEPPRLPKGGAGAAQRGGGASGFLPLHDPRRGPGGDARLG
jgi:hypothetical protein